MLEERDLFSAVMGTGRGAPADRARDRETSDLDRARELAPMVAAALAGEQFLDDVLALRRRAHALNVDVIHGLFSAQEDFDVESPMTLLLSRTGALIGVVEIDPQGAAMLLRPDAVMTWQQ